MKTNKIFGMRYDFEINLHECSKEYSFEILSHYKTTNQKSVITNLNFIISELIYPLMKTTDIDSTIFLNKQKGIKLFKKSFISFHDINWIKLLEEKLDEDRQFGGWNADFEF